MSILLSTSDMVVLLVSLSIPLLLTVVLCLVNRNNITVSHILMGDRHLPVIPVSVSLSISFINVITVINMSQVTSSLFITFYITMLLSYTLAMATIPHMFMSVYYKMHMNSMYEYLEMRFNSSLLRRLVSLVFIVTSQLYLGVIMLTACDLLALITGVPPWPHLLCAGVVSLVVVCCGGVLSVVWTSVWQFVVMVSCGISVVVCGWQDDPQWLMTSLERHVTSMSSYEGSDWYSAGIAGLGQFILWSSVYGCHQTTVHRYVATKSVAQARWTLVLSIAITWICSVATLLSSMVIMEWKYKQQSSEEILLHFIVEVRSEDIVLHFISRNKEYNEFEMYA